MFRFTIRDVLWLTVVVAVALAWLVDHRRLATEVLEQKARAGAFAYLLTDRGYEVRTWNSGGELLKNGKVVQTLP